MAKPAALPDCTCGEDLDAGHELACPRGIFLRREARKLDRVRQQTEREFKRSLDRAAHKMLDDLLPQMMDELIIHAAEGRGFRVNIQITESNGMPWKAAPAEPPQERLIISPHEQ